jgi:ketosteroid isomerase-like protein
MPFPWIPRAPGAVTTARRRAATFERMASGDGNDQDRADRAAAIAFNEAINRRDLGALEALMTGGHTFIDAEGNRVAGKDAVLDAWRGFFAAFPDYRNDWATVTSIGETVVAVGRSSCSNEPALRGPAIWTARTVGHRISEWRVLEDTPATRGRLGLGPRPSG